MMSARLERYIDGGTARGTSGGFQRNDFGVRTSAGLRPTTAEDRTLGRHNEAADGGIRRYAAQAAL
jgi:hypothetical protein